MLNYRTGIGLRHKLPPDYDFYRKAMSKILEMRNHPLIVKVKINYVFMKYMQLNIHVSHVSK